MLYTNLSSTIVVIFLTTMNAENIRIVMIYPISITRFLERALSAILPSMGRVMREIICVIPLMTPRVFTGTPISVRYSPMKLP